MKWMMEIIWNKKKIKGGLKKEHKIYQMRLTLFTDKGSIKCSGVTIGKGVRFVWVGWNNNIKKKIIKKNLLLYYIFFIFQYDRKRLNA
jgi:hypothetical protein